MTLDSGLFGHLCL